MKSFGPHSVMDITQDSGSCNVGSIPTEGVSNTAIC